jgi:HK97 family phage major capsid protein
VPLLAAEAALLSENDRQKGIIEEMIKNDEFFALLPFVKTEGLAYLYTREKVNAQGEWFSEYEDLEESASEFENVTTHLKRIAGQVDIDNFIIETKSDWYDQVAEQLRAKAKGMGHQFQSEVVNGDVAVNAKGFDGVRKLVTADQTLTIAANGAPVDFGALDELVDAVKRKDGKMLMMRKEVWRQIRALNRSFGGNVAETVMVENFGQPMFAYDGVPVLINDFLPIDEVQGNNVATTSIYAMRVNEIDGLHGIYGGASAGFRMEKIGVLEKKDVTRYRMLWYAGLALKATHSLARLKGVAV